MRMMLAAFNAYLIWIVAGKARRGKCIWRRNFTEIMLQELEGRQERKCRPCKDIKTQLTGIPHKVLETTVNNFPSPF